MKLTVLLTMGLMGMFAAPAARAAQAAPAYVNENPADPAPLKLVGVEGRVRGLGGDAMSRASVSLFTEDKHELVGTVMSDKNGKGLYRVVARVEGLCTANIPILVESSILAHHRLEITMQPKDVDKCSYGMAKN
jgi:hypothetical protein